MRVGPLRAAPDPAVAQQHRVQPLLHPLAVIQQVPAGAHQIPHRLLGRGRNPDRRQQPGPVGQRQPYRVPLIGLDLLRGALGDQGRGDHIAGHSHRGQQPVQLVAARPCLVARRQQPPVGEPADQPPYRLLITGDAVHDRHLLAGAQHGAHDLLRGGVHSQMDQLRRRWHTRHDGRLPSVAAVHVTSVGRSTTQAKRLPTAATGAGRFMLTYAENLPADPKDSALVARHNAAVNAATKMEAGLQAWTEGRLPSLDTTEVAGTREAIAREWNRHHQTPETPARADL